MCVPLEHLKVTYDSLPSFDLCVAFSRAYSLVLAVYVLFFGVSIYEVELNMIERCV